MKERPILFSAPMVRALLDGSKTQTRRVCKQAEGLSYVVACQDPKTYSEGQKAPWTTPGWFGDEEGDVQFYCRYGQPGDRLWVRETWSGPLVDQDTWESVNHPSEVEKPEFCLYAADGGSTPEYLDADENLRQGWTPSIHMFRWASRIILEVTRVRVERLQDISRGDAMAEGCPFPNMAQGDDPRKWYADLWNSMKGPGSWDLNPWVWVIEFKRVPA